MKIKTFSEDFYVEEIYKPKILDKGKYAIFLMEKKGWNVLDVVKDISKRTGILEKNIGFAGIKDKNAITKQYISVRVRNLSDVKKIENLKIRDVSFSFVGFSDERINLGDLEGNHFAIVVRDLEKKVDFNFKIKNLFGEQRFSSNNVGIGRCLVKRDFKKACDLLELDVEGNDFVGGLRKISLRMLRFYVSAYQSWLWNIVAEKVDCDEVEIMGFLTEDKKGLYSEICKKEGITKDDFLINEIKEISHEGSCRKLYVDVKNFLAEWSKDNGKLKCNVAFDLDKGCYATVVVNGLFGKSI